MAILETQGLVKDFGGFHAVDGIDLSVEEGSIHAVIGPNGAGKSTFFRLLTGVYSPTSGRVRLGGRDITGNKTHDIARAGLVQVFQIASIFPRLSVLDSMEMAMLTGRRRSGVLHARLQRGVEAEARDILAQVGLDHLAEVESRTLSHGDQRALEVALALGSGPKVLLLDEPTAGMSPYETERMVEIVRDLKRTKGVTIVLSEHDMNVVFDVSDMVTVLHHGRVISEGSPEQVAVDPEVVAVYLGAEQA